MSISNIVNGFKKCASDYYNGGNEQPEGGDLFTEEENALCEERFEESFDMFDTRYNEWLAIHQPEAVVCEDNALYPHFDDHEFTGMEDDFEYMLSLADNLCSTTESATLSSGVETPLTRATDGVSLSTSSCVSPLTAGSVSRSTASGVSLQQPVVPLLQQVVLFLL